MPHRWKRRIGYWLRNGDRARLLREEMDFHVEMKAEELRDNGMNEQDARDAAHRQFGNSMLLREESRSNWIATWLGDLVQDSVFAIRTTRRQPVFTAVAALSASLGIGACSMIFGLANFALLRPLPVSDPSRLVSLTGKQFSAGKSGISISYPDLEDVRQAHSFQGVTGFFQFVPAVISSNGEPRRYWGSLATANYFDVVRPAFAMGRGFDPEGDDRKGAPPVVVLSHRLWQARFAGNPNILGQTIVLNSRAVTVIGVTAADFRGTEFMFYSDFWIPFSMIDTLAQVGMGGDRLHERDSAWLVAAGRLRPGVIEAEAASEVEVIAKRLQDAYPATHKDRGFGIERAGQVNPGMRRMIVVFFVMLLSVAVLVLSTACANIANLLLARASARQKEIATRLAIGAGRWRLIRQLLTESVLLALLGGIGGYAIAQLGAAGLGRLRLPIPLPIDLSVSLDYRVMLFCVALSAVTGVIFGLVPAMRATRPDLVSALHDDQAPFGRIRIFALRNLLVVAQVTICMVLLICSGLFVRSLYSARHIETGFANRNLLMLAFDPSLNGYSLPDARRLLNIVLEKSRAIPGVESAALTSSVPLSLEGTQNSFDPEEKISGMATGGIRADIYSVSTGFFETLGTRMIAGEDFRPGVPADDIVIVNQAAAVKAFPNRNAVGRRILYFGRSVRIIGVAATAKSRTIGEDPHPILYFPIAKEARGNDSLTGITLVVRTRGDPAGYASLVRRTIREIDPALALFDIRTMEEHLAKAMFVPRTAAIIFGLAGVMGLLISTIGIYGVVSFTVARQTKEIGIRMALGARRTQVLRMVLGQALALALIGSIIGLCLALSLSRTAASLLYDVSPTDTFTFIAVPIFLVIIAMLACLLPARRAASIDPIRTLRYE